MSLATAIPAPHPDATATITRYGPIERIELRLRHANIRRQAVACVFRIGDTYIDAGFQYAREALLEVAAERPPRRLILSHHHEDHLGSVAALRRRFEPEVLAPAPLVPYVEAMGFVPWYRDGFWGSIEATGPVAPYTAGTTFVADGVAVETLETPGHCPHHMAFVVRDGGTTYVLSGDLIVSTRPTILFFEGAVPDLSASVRAILALDDQPVLLPSHLPPITDPEPLHELLDHLDRESTRIHAAAARLGTRDPWAVALDLYGPPTNYERMTGGEITRATFVRGVLDPPSTLPVAPIPVPDAPDAAAPRSTGADDPDASRA